MRTTIQHEYGAIFSVKTFRPLWIFPWYASIWREFPFATCLATIRYRDRLAAERGHREVVALLKSLAIGPELSEPFEALEAFAQRKLGAEVNSYRRYPGHAVEGKIHVEITSERR